MKPTDYMLNIRFLVRYISYVQQNLFFVFFLNKFTDFLCNYINSYEVLDIDMKNINYMEKYIMSLIIIT